MISIKNWRTQGVVRRCTEYWPPHLVSIHDRGLVRRGNQGSFQGSEPLRLYVYAKREADPRTSSIQGSPSCRDSTPPSSNLPNPLNTSSFWTFWVSELIELFSYKIQRADSSEYSKMSLQPPSLAVRPKGGATHSTKAVILVRSSSESYK